MNHFFIIQKV